MNKTRTREEIIEDIRNLVKTKGYIYALCMILIEDFAFNLEEIHKTDVHERMSLNEAAFLVRLLIQDEIDLSAPDRLQDLMGLKQKTYELMKELHNSFLNLEKLLGSISKDSSEEGMKQFFLEPDVVVESIFYFGTGIYYIQYLEFLEEKYKYDEDWLLGERNFDTSASKKVAFTIKEILELKGKQNVIPLGLKEKIPETIEKIKKKHPGDWEEHMEKLSKEILAMEWYQYSILLNNAQGSNKKFGREELESFCKSLLELLVVRKSDFENDSGIDSFIKNFSIDLEVFRKQEFKAMGEFNPLTAQPVIPLDETRYFVPIPFLVFEAIYQSPYYWMLNTTYEDQAGHNRGKVGEEIVYNLLSKVFGEDKTFKSVKIKESKKTTETDIDVLCVLGSKALCIQVKSQKLTELSRTGDAIRLVKDFERAVQGAYEQARVSRREILRKEAKFYDENEKEITLPEGIDEVYIMGVTTENYPTLNHQLKLMLNKKSADPYPVFLTIFDLQLVAHYLKDPYDFLYYIRQRISLINYFEAAEEIVYLGYHLIRKLWKHSGGEKYFIPEHYGQLIDRNYYPPKLGLKVSDEGDAIKNRWMNEEFNDLCNRLKTLGEPRITDIIFHLLDLSGKAVQQLMSSMTQTKQKTLRDGKQYNFSIPPGGGAGGLHFGITYVSLNSDNMSELKKKLLRLSQVRKYINKGDVWVGFGSVKSSDAIIDGVVFSDQKWEFNQELEDRARKELPKKGTAIRLRKVGRNELCVCGSPLKYKKCCGA